MFRYFFASRLATERDLFFEIACNLVTKPVFVFYRQDMEPGAGMHLSRMSRRK